MLQMLNKVLVVAIVFRLGVVTSILCSSASEAVGSSNDCRPPKLTLSKTKLRKMQGIVFLIKGGFLIKVVRKYCYQTAHFVIESWIDVKSGFILDYIRFFK